MDNDDQPFEECLDYLENLPSSADDNRNYNREFADIDGLTYSLEDVVNGFFGNPMENDGNHNDCGNAFNTNNPPVDTANEKGCTGVVESQDSTVHTGYRILGIPITCHICAGPTATSGSHQLSTLPCGHVYGMSCIKGFLEKESKCSKCCNPFGSVDIIKLSLGMDQITMTGWCLGSTSGTVAMHEN